MLSENVLRANGSDGSTNVFATPSGMVGTPNAIGAWYFWMPAEGVIFDAEYWGMRVTITRDSRNTYLYSPDGGASMSSHQYAARWRGAQYFDVAGRAINSPADENRAAVPEATCSARPTKSSPAGSVSPRSCTTNARAAGSGTPASLPASRRVPSCSMGVAIPRGSCRRP